MQRIHLRGALRGTGRLAFVCWRALTENPWAAVPLEAAARVLGRPEPAPPDAPGPFSFGDPKRVRGALEGAGFRDVAIVAFDATNSFGGSGSLGDAARDLARLRPVARLLVNRDERDVAKALAAIEAALPAYIGAQGGASFRAAAWIVTAAR